MGDENLGNFFKAENFDDGDSASGEALKPMRLHGGNLFKKAIDILHLTQTICDLLPTNDHAEITKRLMLENALLVPAKIKGAMAVDEVYSIIMESAVIVKVNICQLKAQLWACEAIHNVEQKYLDVLRYEIEEFRQIFILWINSFDRENDLPDEWHIFNDPSSFPTEPFDDKDFFEDINPDDEDQ